MLQLSTRGELKSGLTDAEVRRERICALRRVIEQSYLDLGRLVAEAFRAEDWKPLGYPSFRDYMIDILGVSKSETYDLMQLAALAERFPAYVPKMLEAGKSKMRLILPELRGNVDAATAGHWIEQAAEHTWVELNATMRDEPPYADVVDGVRLVEIKCKHCGAIDSYEV